MFGHLGFSYIGLLYLLLLFIPNIFWAKRQPAGYSEVAQKESKILLLLERMGQVCVTCTALIFSDFNIVLFSPWSLWLVGSFILMLFYEICWVRYFIEPTLKNFYGSFCFIPVPLALLPVTAFLLLGIYGKVIWMIASVLILGIGHIGIHLQHEKELKKEMH